MASYTPYTAAEYAPDAPATADHFRRWFENCVAIAEGAAGAPAILDAALDTTATTTGRSWVLERNALATAGAVGTYVFANGASDAAFGATVAGSALTPTSALRGVTTAGAGGSGVANVGAALSGTWRAMGTFDAVITIGGTTYAGATLWLRIS